MDSELVIVKKVLFAEVAVRMQKDNVSEFVNVPPLQVLVQLVECVKFLLLQDTSLFLETDVTVLSH